MVASEEISLEEQQAVLEKFDQESNTRNVTGFAKGFIKWYAIAMAVFHVYTSFFGLWATIRQRAMHLLFVMPLCYLMYPAKKGGARNNPSLLDWVFAALSFVCCGYIVVNYDAIFLRGGLPNQMDIIMGCLCALLVLEAVRRVVGTQLLIIAVIFLGYCGDSTITEVVGMGAFAGAAAPSVLRLRGGTYQDGINQSMDMRTLTVGLNSNYPIPLLDFTGPGLAIDIRKVINTGTPVVCHGGIISKDGGQIGAGIATFPMEVYVDAMYAFLKKYGIE